MRKYCTYYIWREQYVDILDASILFQYIHAMHLEMYLIKRKPLSAKTTVIFDTYQ